MKKKILSFAYQLHFLKVWIKGKFFYIVVIIYLNVLCKNVKEFPTIKDPFTFRGPLLAGQGNYFISNLIMWSRYVTRIDHYMKWTYNLSEFRLHISA